MNILEEMLEYLRTASNDQLQTDFEELKEFTEIGPSMSSLFEDIKVPFVRCDYVLVNHVSEYSNYGGSSYALAA